MALTLEVNIKYNQVIEICGTITQLDDELANIMIDFTRRR